MTTPTPADLLTFRVAALTGRVLADPHILTYQEAEEVAKALAARMIDTFGNRELKGFRYTTIPRGGFFVLGMLAYVLDLPRNVFGVMDNPQLRNVNTPLVVVDDCSLTGRRFGEFLESDDSPQVVFAHLYSHPDLRAAIQKQESRVVACLAAHDLRDLAPEIYPKEDDYQEWQARWRSRFRGRRFWIGLPEMIVFPWNEPDRYMWNPVTKQIEHLWRFGPPDRCLKNWVRLGLPPHAGTQTTFRSPDHIVLGLAKDGGVTLCNAETGRVYNLEGIAAEMWRALAAYGDPQAVIQYLLPVYEVDEATLRKDLQVFMDQLLASGLLEPCGQ